MKPKKRKLQKRIKHNGGHVARPPANQPLDVINKIEELPPNENLKKLPDEVYGDTEIPRKHRNL